MRAEGGGRGERGGGVVMCDLWRGRFRVLDARGWRGSGGRSKAQDFRGLRELRLGVLGPRGWLVGMVVESSREPLIWDHSLSALFTGRLVNGLTHTRLRSIFRTAHFGRFIEIAINKRRPVPGFNGIVN